MKYNPETDRFDEVDKFGDVILREEPAPKKESTQLKKPTKNFVNEYIVGNAIAWSISGILAFFVLFAPFGVPRMSTIGIGILILIGCITYVLIEEDRNKAIAFGVFVGVTILLYLALPKATFANIIAYLIFVPITIMMFHHFATIASIPIAGISPAGGYVGYLALQAFGILAMVLFLSYFDGGMFIRAFVRDVMYLFHWDWIAWLLDTDGDYTNPFYYSGKGAILNILDMFSVERHLDPESLKRIEFSHTKEWAIQQLQHCQDLNDEYAATHHGDTVSSCETYQNRVNNWKPR